MYNSIFSAHVYLFLQLMEPHAMFGNRNKIFNIEKNTQFVDRVLFLSLPSARQCQTGTEAPILSG